MPKPNFKSKQDYLEEIVRVDYAGEYAANVIYQAQIENASNAEVRQQLEDMLYEEQKHLQFFTQEMRQRRVRPSALMPLWHLLSMGLGKVSARLGHKHMMLATQAVEEVIQEHYSKQVDILENLNEERLRESIVVFREDELHHRDVATSSLHGKMNFLDSIFAKAVKFGCRAAIEVCKKI